ncbi:DUF4406 domain-containing protein [Enterobacter sp. JMULE2]|uniref:DUF4406 domain-containing protein n=1 Tax=Enterobacter sp. JMULE2 TaxID=2518340 RepID=UPI00157503E6|nr:DUF4406 domain-containing protein [Enterobacter sp. JMULE2]
MIVYIAGPMSGLENFNRPAFHLAAEKLSRQGYTVLNPAVLPDGLTQPQYMNVCISMLQCADEIYLLEGWKESEGARAEHALAVKLGLTVREAFTVVIEELGLTVRTLNALRRHRITTLDELSGRLSSLSGMLGKKRYHEIRNAIETQQERRS